MSNTGRIFRVWNVDLRGDRSLTLRYIPHNRAPLDKAAKVYERAYCIGYGEKRDVMLEQQNEDSGVELLEHVVRRA